MQKQLTLKLLPSEAANETIVKNLIALSEATEPQAVNGYHILKKSIDARSHQPWVNLRILAYINEPVHAVNKKIDLLLKNVHQATKQIIIIGAGPAGLFAALTLLKNGIKPIILERGKDVRSRRRDLAMLNKEGIVNPDSNYCFGEGGAGTYSDGKLYTRSHKRGNVQRILQLFHYFGAGEEILYEAHPHIGTNKLPGIITSIREKITEYGGQICFQEKVTDLIVQNDVLHGVVTANGDKYRADSVILATGHSARDIFELLYKKNIHIGAKPFALGVRVEHPQSIIDKIQYHCNTRDRFLPPAAYSLVHRVNNRGVFSFCMCPGGIIAPASTNNDELVVNGWSPSKRNNPFANSGIVVEVSENDIKDLKDFEKITGARKSILTTALSMMYFQKYVERKAHQAGGGKIVAPAQRLADFCENKLSSSLPGCSYLPGIHSSLLKEVLPGAVYLALRAGFKEFGKKMKGYYTNEAVVVAAESRTSSPVRIPRNKETLEHPQIRNLYPCGEGAGYAGGIVSAAMDGEKVASVIAEKIQR